jgi:hypothetical protein
MAIAQLWGIGAALLLWGAASARVYAEQCPSQVRVSFPNFEIAPYVLGTDEVATPPGLMVQWVANALARAGCTPLITIRRRPPNRQLAELDLGLLDILPGFAPGNNPDGKLAFPMRGGVADPGRVVLADTVSLYVRAGERNVEWDGKTLTSVNPKVGTSTGGAGFKVIAATFGWQIELAATPRADLDKLLARRIDVIVEPDVVMQPYLAGSDGKAVRKLSPPALTKNRYAPVRKEFAQQYPEFTSRFWLELCRQSRTTMMALPACR